MARRRTGSLSAEDRELWKRVTQKVTRRGPKILPQAEDVVPATTVPAPERAPSQTAVPPPLDHLRIGGKARPVPASHDLKPSLTDRLAQMAPSLDGNTHARLKRGKLRPDARIDLHGMTLAQAHPVLVRFLSDAHARQIRLVLVITGKGKDRDDGGPMPVPRGVLRHQVPHWLQTGPLRPIVLQVTQAHFRHGGEGAYYVYLRRQR